MPNHPIQGAVLKRLDDTDWAVRRQLAATLGELPPGSKEAALASLLERHGDDPIAVDAALSGSRGSELAVLDRLLQGAGETPQRSAAITMLAATIVRVGEDAPVQTLMQRVAETSRAAGSDPRSCEAQRSRCSARRCRGRRHEAAGDPNAPCETCPGGRGGPGGARAFPGALEGADPPAPPARAGGPFVALSREPALIAVAANQGAGRSRRESDGANRMAGQSRHGAGGCGAERRRSETIRGRAGDLQEPVRGMSRRRRTRAAGRDAEHRRRAERDWRAGVPIRVLLHGKEGPIGLMPAHGDTLNDAEIAAVLTYIRRAWGQTAAPIDAAAVQQVRAATAGRTRAWTPKSWRGIK